MRPMICGTFAPVQLRRMSFLPLGIAVGIAATIAAPDAFAGGTQAPSGQRTYPHVRPRVGGRHSRFKLSFTLAQAPGREGTEETEYRAVVSRPANSRESCPPTQPAPVASGNQGELERITLQPPEHGWCRGRYDVTVYLQRTQTCGPPIVMAPRIVCPASAEVGPALPDEDLNTGTTHFTVRYR